MLGRRRTTRAQDDIEEVEDSGLEVPDDAIVALQLLRSQFPKTPTAGAHPVVLVSQIYSLVKDRTTVDRQLDKAMRLQEIRLFRSACQQPCSFPLVSVHAMLLPGPLCIAH